MWPGLLSQLLITTCWDTLAETRPVKDGAK
jgi:hypothetical protein